jgi:hypothetical protein
MLNMPPVERYSRRRMGKTNLSFGRSDSVSIFAFQFA